MTKDKSSISFDKTIAGFNITENGIQFTVNARESGVRGSISIPGTGLSKQNIKLF
jgi:hypothetical protein